MQSLLVLLALTSPVAPTDFGEILHEAKLARSEEAVTKERVLLERALELGGGDDRGTAEAERRLAKIEWKYYERYDDARERLLKAAQGADPVQAWLELTRLELHREEYPSAVDAASKVVELAPNSGMDILGRATRAHAVISAGAAARRDGSPAPDDVRGAVEEMRRVVDELPGVLEPAASLTLGAALVRDVEALRKGWESYYHIDEQGHGPDRIDIPGLRKALESWPTTTDEYVELVERLGDTHLYNCAELVALDPEASDEVRANPGVREIAAYSRTLRGLRRSIPDYYRRVSLGKPDRNRLDRILRDAMKDLAPDLVGVNPRKLPTPSQVKTMIAERFGADYSTGLTGGEYCVHYGHIVVDVTRSVEQYGRSGQLRYVVLDNIVSNGYPDWGVNGEGSTGGWMRPNEMWQVRPAYAGRSIQLWLRFADQQIMREFEEELEDQEREDELRAREDPFAYVPSVPMRLQHQAVTALHELLVAEGFEGGALRDEFMRAYEAAVQESSIFAHEGRHAIDGNIKRSDYPKPNSEFTAKLSEIAFAPIPRLAVCKILGPSSGTSRHAVANLAVLEGLLDWMEERPGKIEGFDAERPAVLQVGLLTDEQLREACRSMDPLVQGF